MLGRTSTSTPPARLASDPAGIACCIANSAFMRMLGPTLLVLPALMLFCSRSRPSCLTNAHVSWSDQCSGAASTPAGGSCSYGEAPKSLTEPHFATATLQWWPSSPAATVNPQVTLLPHCQVSDGCTAALCCGVSRTSAVALTLRSYTPSTADFALAEAGQPRELHCARSCWK